MIYKHIKFTESPTMRSLERIAWEKGLISNNFLKLLKLIKSASETDQLNQIQLDQSVSKIRDYLSTLWSGDDIYKKISKLAGKVIDKNQAMPEVLGMIKKIPVVLANIDPKLLGEADYEKLKININPSTPLNKLEAVLIHEFNHFINFVVRNRFGISPDIIDKSQSERLSSIQSKDYSSRLRENIARVPEVRYALNLDQITTIDELNKALSKVINNYSFNSNGYGYITSNPSYQNEVDFYHKHAESSHVERLKAVHYHIDKDRISDADIRKFFISKIFINIKQNFNANNYSLATLLMQFFVSANLYHNNASSPTDINNIANTKSVLVLDLNQALRAFNELAQYDKKDPSSYQSSMA